MTIWFAAVLLCCASAAAVGVRVLHDGVLAHRQVRLVERRMAALVGRPVESEAEEQGAFDTAVRELARLSLWISRDLQTQSRRVREAGMFAHGAVNRFLALRLVLPAVGVVIAPAIGLAAGLPPMMVVALTLAAVVSGHMGPVLVLRLLGHVRTKRVFRELPFFLDSVKLLLQTGASLELSLRQIARMDIAAIPEIRRTLSYFLEDLDQGKSYDLAFERWAEKLAAPDAEELAGLMLQSLMHGTELTPMLEQFVQEQIERRLTMAREVAGKRSVSMTVVMVAFFLPPLVVIIGAPAAVDIARTILE